MSSRTSESSRPTVAAIVLPAEGQDVAATVSAIGEQVYGVAQTVIVGGGAPEGEFDVAADIATAADLVDRAHSHVWFVTAGARPDNEALGSLISESARVGAGIAGSKLVADDESGHLLEVGMSTDVYGIPYSGLEPDEIDAGQYDVVRDVSWVSTASMLVRRDLLVGLGGLSDDVARGAAAMDLCQRAHLRGARVVVVPSAVVRVAPELVRYRGWRERFGQLRTIAATYSAVTLIWVLPLRFAIGLVEAILAPFVGRWTLFSWIQSWVWFVATLGSTLARRRSVRQGTPQPDEALFRFQVRGSARLRSMGSLLVKRLRDRMPQDDRFTLAGLGRDIRRPSIVAGFATALFALVATRALWNGFPMTGFLAPLGDDAREAVVTYAGGWNPAGLGSTEPVEPVVGALGVIQTVLFGDPALTAGVVSLGAMVAGVWGMVRLLRSWGVDTAPALAGGVVLVAGPASRAIADATAIGALVATALLPWVVRFMTSPWPAGWLSRIGRIGAVAFTSALLAVFAPLVLAVAVAAVVVWMVFGTARGRWAGLLSASIGVGGAAVALRPWIDHVDLAWYLDHGSAYWRPGPIVLAFLGLVALGTVLFAPGQLARAGVWGAFIAVAGAVVARLDELGVGREPELAGLAAVAFGSAVVVAAALEAVSRSEFDVRGVARVGIGVAAAAALVVVASTMAVLVGGRLGLPGEEFPDMVQFVAARDDGGEARVLILGEADGLPGPRRDVDGAVYRIVDAPDPHFAAVRSTPSDEADAALDDALRSIATGASQRAGATLAPFGVRWVIVVGETPFEPLLNRQLDLRPLHGLSRLTYVSDVEAGRAVTGAGDIWRWTGVRYEGTPLPGGRVAVAEAADPGWGPEPWEQDGWANVVDASTGSAEFERDAQRSQAALVSLLAMAGFGLVGVGARRWR